MRIGLPWSAIAAIVDVDTVENFHSLELLFLVFLYAGESRVLPCCLFGLRAGVEGARMLILLAQVGRFDYGGPCTVNSRT